MNSKIVIKLQSVSKRYTIHSSKPTFIENINPFIKSKSFWALKDISLSVDKGQCLGIIGPNGSGKTTLLKIITGVTHPTTGKVYTRGQVISLIDLAAGFDMELSGRDNINLQLSLLNPTATPPTMSRQNIIKFADIGPFIDEPLYTYSSGMIVRLAFAIITVIPADIYLIDEYLAVGDADFRLKCLNFLQKIHRQQKTILAASHDLGWLLGFCDQVTVLNKGVFDQPDTLPTHLLEFYRRSIRQKPPPITITSTSMLPTLAPGTTVSITNHPFSQIKPGMIIAFIFSNYNQVITHRVIAVGRQNRRRILITQGDALLHPDPWVVTKNEYIGTVNPPD